MASRTKKTAAKSSDTVTFKKTELISKLKDFLEHEGACEGDWLNKVRTEFLGEKPQLVRVKLQYETTAELEMHVSGVPTEEEVSDVINSEAEDGMLDIDIDYTDFKILDIKVR